MLQILKQNTCMEPKNICKVTANAMFGIYNKIMYRMIDRTCTLNTKYIVDFDIHTILMIYYIPLTVTYGTKVYFITFPLHYVEENMLMIKRQ